MALKYQKIYQMGTKTAEIPMIVLQIHYEPLKTMEDVTKYAEKYPKT